MNANELLNMPLWQMTGAEFIQLNRHFHEDSAQSASSTTEKDPATDHHRYVYGIAGIAEVFHCSIPTANRIKKSGRIDAAITQIGRKIVVDADLALELAGRKPSFPNKRRNR